MLKSLKIKSISLFLLVILLTTTRSEAVYEFNVTVCASGCDYTAFSTAESAIDNVGDLTSAASACGAWDAQSGSAIADATAVTWDSGVSTGTLHHQTDAGSSGEYILTVSGGTLDDNDIVSDGTNTFTVNGNADTCAIVLECGAAEDIDGGLSFSGFTTDADNNLRATGGSFKHNGTPASGCVITRNTFNVLSPADSNLIYEDLIIEETANSATNSNCISSGSSDTNMVFRRIIVNTCVNAGAGVFDGIANLTASTSSGVVSVLDSQVINPEADGIRTGNTTGVTVNLYNNSVISAGAHGIESGSANGTVNAVNNLAFDSATADYAGTFDTFTTNGASDTTGDPVGLDSLTSSSEFTSVTGGSEDLHILTGAVAKDAGTDLGSTNAVDVDIDGTTRSGTWDVGSDEFVSVASSTSGISGMTISGSTTSGI